MSCRRLHMDSFLYLRDVFTRLPSLPADRLNDLLPARWLESHPEARTHPSARGTATPTHARVVAAGAPPEPIVQRARETPQPTPRIARMPAVIRRTETKWTSVAAA